MSHTISIIGRKFSTEKYVILSNSYVASLSPLLDNSKRYEIV